MDDKSPNARFKEAREQLGLSLDDLAFQCDVPPTAIRDIEWFSDDLICCYSPHDLQKFCRALKIRPIELFAPEFSELAVSTDELIQLIHEECRSRQISLDQFEEAVGWYLSNCMDPPERLLPDMSIDGLQWLCRELHLDWRRVILGL
jgi:transcriptional regulator with XRE-family HTH domain